MKRIIAKAKTKTYEPYALARPFLARVRQQKEEIESRTFSLEAVQSMAGRVTCTLSMTPVIHSKNPSAMDESVARIMEGAVDLRAPAPEAPLKLVRSGETLATGRFGRVGEQPAFLIDCVA